MVTHCIQFLTILLFVNSEIHLDDVHPVAFLNVLRFIYTDEILLDPCNVLQTLYVAKKYAVTVMEQACVDFLSQAITVENAFMLLTQANYFDESELSQKCLEVRSIGNLL